MPFTGKATYSAGADLPELVDDVADLVSIVSPHETPVLDLFGDAKRSTGSTVHEWLEDSLLPNTDSVNQTTFAPDATNAVSITVANGNRFRVGDQVRPDGLREVMLVTAVAGNVLTVVRRYGNTTGGALANGLKLFILGNAAIEGDDRPATQYTTRTRRRNYTQIFTAGVEVSGSMQAARTLGTADEFDYQKQERLRELLRDLENCVINGVAAAANPQGGTGNRRTMNGIIPGIVTNQFVPGVNGFPVGNPTNQISEQMINTAMRQIWEQSSGRVDTILVSGAQKRKINDILVGSRLYISGETILTNRVAIYESDFGTCRVLMSRWVPSDHLLLLDSSRFSVVPMTGRSFHFKPLAATGDSQTGMLIGEYTLEMRNENAHGVIRGLATV